MVVFLVVILRFWRPKKSFSSKSYPFSQGSMVLALRHPLIIFFNCENSFHPSGAIQESFQFDSPKTIISGLFIPAFTSHSPNLTGAPCKYSLVSSWSLRSLVSKFSQVSLFIFQFFLVMRSFSSFVLSILTVVRPTFLFCCYRINSFVLPKILPVSHSRFSHVCAISLLILSTRISSMPNLLLVINLIDEG